MPAWLHFVKGVVYSDDLPLNIPRVTLRQNKFLRKPKKHLVKTCLEMFAELAEKNDDYKSPANGAHASSLAWTRTPPTVSRLPSCCVPQRQLYARRVFLWMTATSSCLCGCTSSRVLSTLQTCHATSLASRSSRTDSARAQDELGYEAPRDACGAR